MGGIGSGQRYRWGTKRTVESCYRLDVRYLYKVGYLTSGRVVPLTWRNGTGELRGSILLVSARTSVILRYRSWRGGETWQEVEETVPLVWTPCHYGRHRPWFLCPGVRNGHACKRRVAILYDAGVHFLCRQCSRLTYASQNENQLNRSIRKVRKIRERLGISTNLQETIRWNSSRVHWKTFSRLAHQAHTLEGSASKLLAEWHVHRRARVGRLITRADSILKRYKKLS